MQSVFMYVYNFFINFLYFHFIFSIYLRIYIQIKYRVRNNIDNDCSLFSRELVISIIFSSSYDTINQLKTLLQFLTQKKICKQSKA